jgi:hypothetical protein
VHAVWQWREPGLPFVFPGGLVENVFAAVDGEDAVLESALPTSDISNVYRQRLAIVLTTCS